MHSDESNLEILSETMLCLKYLVDESTKLVETQMALEKDELASLQILPEKDVLSPPINLREYLKNSRSQIQRRRTRMFKLGLTSHNKFFNFKHFRNVVTLDLFSSLQEQSVFRISTKSIGNIRLKSIFKSMLDFYLPKATYQQPLKQISSIFRINFFQILSLYKIVTVFLHQQYLGTYNNCNYEDTDIDLPIIAQSQAFAVTSMECSFSHNESRLTFSRSFSRSFQNFPGFSF